MKLNCGEPWTPDREVRRRAAWHRWFAWYPVRTGPLECRWLETVERRCVDCVAFVAMLDAFDTAKATDAKPRYPTPRYPTSVLVLSDPEWEHRGVPR